MTKKPWKMPYTFHERHFNDYTVSPGSVFGELKLVQDDFSTSAVGIGLGVHEQKQHVVDYYFMSDSPHLLDLAHLRESDLQHTIARMATVSIVPDTPNMFSPGLVLELAWNPTLVDNLLGVGREFVVPNNLNVEFLGDEFYLEERPQRHYRLHALTHPVEAFKEMSSFAIVSAYMQAHVRKSFKAMLQSAKAGKHDADAAALCVA